MAEDYGDFKEDSEELESEDQEQNAPSRIKMPRKGEIMGRIVQRYGGNRMEVLCTDGKARNCRVPGRYRRKLWLRPGDIVIVTPWEHDDEKADIIFKYHKGQVANLKKKGFLDSIKDEF